LAIAALVSLCVGLAVTAVVLARSHCWANRQRLFAQRIQGLSLARRHGRFMVETAALWLGCGLLGWRLGWIETPVQVLASLVLGMVFSGFLASILAVRDRRECASYLRSA
jgi:hypothetical protein